MERERLPKIPIRYPAGVGTNYGWGIYTEHLKVIVGRDLTADEFCEEVIEFIRRYQDYAENPLQWKLWDLDRMERNLTTRYGILNPGMGLNPYGYLKMEKENDKIVKVMVKHGPLDRYYQEHILPPNKTLFRKVYRAFATFLYSRFSRKILRFQTPDMNLIDCAHP